MRQVDIGKTSDCSSYHFPVEAEDDWLINAHEIAIERLAKAACQQDEANALVIHYTNLLQVCFDSFSFKRCIQPRLLGKVEANLDVGVRNSGQS